MKGLPSWLLVRSVLMPSEVSGFPFQRVKERAESLLNLGLRRRSFPPSNPLFFSHVHLPISPKPKHASFSLSDPSDLHRLPSAPRRPLHSAPIYPHLPKAPAPLLSPISSRPPPLSSPSLPVLPLHPIKKQPPHRSLCPWRLLPEPRPPFLLLLLLPDRCLRAPGRS